MVIGAAKNLINTLLQYLFVTHWLYIRGFLGLNMIEPPKPLIDSGLAVRFLSVSNKIAPKVYEKAPFRVQVKIKFYIRLTTLVQR
jgi:hypothetical protein